MHLSGQVAGVAAGHLRVLDGDRFDAEREATITSVLAMAGVEAGELPRVLASGPVFNEHSKLGGSFDAATERAEDPRLAEEIDQTRQWIGMIAQQAGLELPLPQTLF